MNATGALDTITWINSNSRAYGASIANFAPFVAPVVSGGGGATPVREWDGRSYARGNVETVYRGRSRHLNPEPLVLMISVSATLETYKPSGVNPRLEASPQQPPRRVPRTFTLQSRPDALILSINNPALESIHPSITQISRLESKQNDRLGRLEGRIDTLESELRESLRTNRRLQSELSTAKQEIIDLEDRLILGVD